MDRLPEEWVEKARVFINDVERHLREGHYWLVCFEAQQAAELYLKALIVAKTGSHPFTHDLAELMNVLEELGLRLPSELKHMVTCCHHITPWLGIQGVSQ